VAGVGLQQMQGIVEWGMEGREGGPVMRADRAGRIGRAGFEEHHRQFLVSVGNPAVAGSGWIEEMGSQDVPTV